MKYLIAIGLAAIGIASCGAAQADTYLVRETVSRYVACYDKVYVPATVEVNTRGKLVRAESRGWETSPDRWDYVRSPAVYIQSRRTVSPDHYTLVARPC